MRERGVQSRRVRPGQVEPHRRPGPPPQRPGGNGNFWQVLAIIALVAATAGWTTVAVLALRPAPAAEAEVPIEESFDPEATIGQLVVTGDGRLRFAPVMRGNYWRQDDD